MQIIKGWEENALFRNEIYTKVHEIPNKNKQVTAFFKCADLVHKFCFPS